MPATCPGPWRVARKSAGSLFRRRPQCLTDCFKKVSGTIKFKVPDTFLKPFLNMNAAMLRELAVQNLAVIEDVRVELQPGFCAWTGETGAGKSLLLGALGPGLPRSADRSGEGEPRCPAGRWPGPAGPRGSTSGTCGQLPCAPPGSGSK